MNTSEGSYCFGYCRLCAQLQHKCDLLDLSSHDDIKMREVVMEKLTRLNSETNFSDDILPKTVCFECLRSLDQAFKFVLCIESSQSVLSEIFLKKIKNEHNNYCFGEENEVIIPPENQEDYCVDEKDEVYLPDDLKDPHPYDVDLKEEIIQSNVKLLEDEEKQNTIMIHTHGKICKGKSEAQEIGKFFDCGGNEVLPGICETKAPEKCLSPCKEYNDILSKQDKYKSKLQVKVPIYNEDNKVAVPNKIIDIKTQPTDKTTNSCDDNALPSSQLLTWRDYSWSCSHCETQFTTIDELRTHSMQYHKTCNAYRCTDCNIRSVKLHSFLIHVKRHRNHLKLSCYKCFKTFPTPTQSKSHEKEHKDGKHICNGCNTAFTSVEKLSNHTKSFLDSIKRKRRNPSKNFICDKCGKCFARQNLIAHLKVHESERPYECQICKAAYKRRNDLTVHMGTHDVKKPFICEICGKCFRLRKNVRTHQVVHSNALPYTCSYCNKSFRYKKVLNGHILTHTGVKPYSCEPCKHDFAAWKNYSIHMKRWHGKDMSKMKRTKDGVFRLNQITVTT